MQRDGNNIFRKHAIVDNKTAYAVIQRRQTRNIAQESAISKNKPTSALVEEGDDSVDGGAVAVHLPVTADEELPDHLAERKHFK